MELKKGTPVVPSFGDFQILIGQRGNRSAPGGSLNQAGLDEVRFVIVFQGVHGLPYGDCQGFRADRPTVIAFNYYFEYFPVEPFKPQ